VGGNSYTLRLTTAYTDEAATSGYSTISFAVNAAPTSGTFQVSPDSAFAFGDTFTFSMSGWTDDADDRPFMYTFGYVLGSIDDAAHEVVVRSQRHSATSSVMLPQGSGINYSLIAVAYVADAW
ncbi:unnamed protein product, partial [Phaeothamnion confervicola]